MPSGQETSNVEEKASSTTSFFRSIGPNPTEKDMQSPVFLAVWRAIKGWDIQRAQGEGYAGAVGNDVMTILKAIDSITAERDSCLECEDGAKAVDEQDMLIRELKQINEQREKELACIRDEAAATNIGTLMQDIRYRGWEYEVKSVEAWRDDDGNLLRNAAHEITIRIPTGQEVTILAFSPEALFRSAMRAATAVLARDDPAGMLG